MNLFVNFFSCGKIIKRSNVNRCDYYIQDFNNIYNNFLPHFNNYSLSNIKSLDYLDFKKAAELFKINGKNSIESIREIISNMNTKRKK